VTALYSEVSRMLRVVAEAAKMSVVVTCRLCGTELEPDHRAVVAGPWRLCPACRPEPPGPTHCRRCGRVLRGVGRTLCLGCLGVPAL
jgi:hypothetical protein